MPVAEIPCYERVVVETTGIADPVPIAYTLLAEPVLQHHYRLGNVVTVVDAVNGERQLDRFAESVKQVALADRLVVSKLDLAGPGALEALRPRLTNINPDALVATADTPDLDPVGLLVTDIHDRRSKGMEVERWMRSDGGRRGGARRPATRTPKASTPAASPSTPPWTGPLSGCGCRCCCTRHGDRVLRMKGLLNVAGVPGRCW